MLSLNEFTIGNVGSAKPLSLILPSRKYDETILVGRAGEVPTAVFLSGQHHGQLFESLGNTSWGGIIIPNIRVEIDEASAVDVEYAGVSSLFVIRLDTRLVIVAKGEKAFARSNLVTLHDNLVPESEFRAAFAGWQIVVGEGSNKRIVWSQTGA
ncbi:hypothetical protein [Mameliella alba]|uniref:hypothetical protein n=1 Tax=Mameliella alba TaxID=561184 RepID=UPI000945C005|nr:hypothetical protein [Mameliella alba]GGF86396.1 hypothetical protein GCM10011319_52730 [Mameliella alba]